MSTSQLFYICRFSDTWTLFDTKTSKSRSLTADETDLLKRLFSGLLNDNSKILSAVKVEAISPNKLLQLPMNTGGKS